MLQASFLQALSTKFVDERDYTIDDVTQQLGDLCAEGEYEAALAFATQAAAAIEAADEPDREALAGALHGLAVVHQCTGTYRDVAEYADRAIALWDELGMSHDPGLAVALHTRATAYLAEEDIEQAVPLLERAASILQEAGGEHRQDLDAVLLTMAEVSLQLGQLESARSLYARILEDLSEAQPESDLHAAWLNGMMAKVFLGLGGSYARSEEPGRATDYLARSIEFFESAYGVRHPEVVEAKQAVAEMYRMLGELEAAASLEEEIAAEHLEMGDGDEYEADSSSGENKA